jgi:hypothetical protein
MQPQALPDLEPATAEPAEAARHDAPAGPDAGKNLSRWAGRFYILREEGDFNKAWELLT